MTGINKITLALLALFASTAGSHALAADLDGAKLFADKTCATCHGKDANTPIMAGYPAIGGQSAEYALQQMKDIKSGARNNGQAEAMKVVMQLVSDEEMAALAKYVSTLEYKPGMAVSRLDKTAAPAAATLRQRATPAASTHSRSQTRRQHGRAVEKDCSGRQNRCTCGCTRSSSHACGSSHPIRSPRHG